MHHRSIWGWAATVLMASACGASTLPPAASATGARARCASLPRAHVEPPQPSAATPIVAPLSELAGLDLEARFGGYAGRDAQWVRGQPIAVNRAFDFGRALSLEGAGAGLAVVQRRKGNAELAEQLAQLPAIDAAALVAKICAQRPAGCAAIAGARLRCYAQVFGVKAARVRVVSERVDGASQSVALYASISAPHALADLVQPGALAAIFEAELARTLDLFDVSTATPDAKQGECDAGDGLHVSGAILSRTPQRVVLSTTDPKSVASCRTDAFSETSPAPLP
jgi:hypothetical protein